MASAIANLNIGSPSATELLLDITNTFNQDTLTTSQIGKIGEAFEFSATTMRAATSRLVKKGLLRPTERGLYSINILSDPMSVFISGWRRAGSEIVDWNGDWILAALPTGNSLDRTAQRQTTRTLDLLGLRQWRPNLWVRPNNIMGGVRHIADQLYDFGGADKTDFMKLSELKSDQGRHLLALWDTGQKNEMATIIKNLHKSQSKLGSRNTAKAANETLRLGRTAVKCILRSPRLPHPYGSTETLIELITTMEQYKKFGTNVWSEYLGQ